jgi:Ser/Thr protein kinase RdoA (MazF antagonist)
MTSPSVPDSLRPLYAWDALPEYFAGGHEWSDGTLFRYAYKGEDRLLKLMPARSEQALDPVRERQAFLEYLNLHGVDTTLPLRSERGELAELVTLEGRDYVAYAWRMVPGEHITLGDPRDCRDFYARWGRLLGKLHRLAQSLPDWRHSACRDARGVPLISRRREWDHFFNWFRDDGIKAAWLRMRQDLDRIPVRRDNHGFIHNDAHPHNILQDGSRLILIDFDVANYLWFALDLAICVYSEYSRVNFHSPYAYRNEELDAIFVTPFLQAYESENPLPAGEYVNIELFLNYRRFLMFACFYDQIKANAPAYLEQMKRDIITARPYLPADNCFRRRLEASSL